MSIRFNIPYVNGNELNFIQQAIQNGKLSGDGHFSNLCQSFLENKYGFGKCLMTHSCTGALEMIAILLNIQPGDEVIIPSYTFVSTANAFMLRGAVVKFADSDTSHPNVSVESIAKLINKNTKAIVCVHYAGFSCDLESLRMLCDVHNLYLVEDAAQGIHSFFKDSKGASKPVGSIGDFAAFSFHDSKNIQCGEGGALVLNNPSFYERADVIWEKGTNRTQFMRGKIDRYEWIDIGSSFLMSEIHAAFLWAQLNVVEKVTEKRQNSWLKYVELLSDRPEFQIPTPHEMGNAHIFFVVCKSAEHRAQILQKLNEKEIQSTTHYQSLSSAKVHQNPSICINASNFQNKLLRLPMHFELTEKDVELVCNTMI